MAPVPKETNKPQNDNMAESDADSLHNPTIVATHDEGNSDSSDEDYQDMIAPGGYSLLPSEPGNFQEDSDSDYEAENEKDLDLDIQNSSQTVERTASAVEEGSVPNVVLASEAGSSTPRTQVSDASDNPAAREKYPHGKIPSYLHVPNLPREKGGLLWNEKRSGVKKTAIDKGHESAILKAMSGFQLPPESIPAWAKNIPEEHWRQKIHSRIASSIDNRDAPDQSFSHGAEESTTEQWVAEFPDDA